MSAKGTGPRVTVRNVRQVRVEANGLDPAKGAPSEVLFATGSIAAGVKDSLVAAVTGKKIRVLAIWLVGDGSNAVQLLSGTATGGTALTPLGVFPATAVKRIKDEHGICQTAVATALSVGSGATSATGTITVAYVLV